MVNKLLGKAVKGVAGAIVGEVGVDLAKQAIPAVGQMINDKMEYDKSLIQLPDVTKLNVLEAKEVLEKMGFVVLTTLEKPDKKYLVFRDDSVVAMEPKPGKYAAGSLVKLHYVDHDVLEEAYQISKLEKKKQEEFQKELGKHFDNFGKEVGKHADNIGKEVVKHADNLNKEIGKNVDNFVKFVANPFGKKGK